MKGMPPVVKKGLMDAYNSKVEAARAAMNANPAEAREINSSYKLFDTSFALNDHYSFVHIYTFYLIKRKKKHPRIFELVLDF
jgi:hypothetical protein